MPYIPIEDQCDLIGDFPKRTPDTAGELTFFLTYTINGYIRKHGKKFLTCCIIMGALICTMFEFYRRVVAPYEDTKIKENGDVY